MSIASLDRKNWLTAVDASIRLGIGIRALPRVAALNGIRVREINGKKGQRYNGPDIDRYIAQLERREAAQVAGYKAGSDPPNPARERARQ